MVIKLCRVLLVCLVLVLVVGPLSAAEGLASGEFRYPLFYVPQSLDPVVDNSISTNHIVNQVYDGLVAFDDNLRVQPGLAENWRVSRDGLEYTFKLRKNVTFHDGGKFSAADAVYSLTRVFHPDNEFFPEMLLDRVSGAQEFIERTAGNVSGIEEVSEYEVFIRLNEPYAPFLSALAMPIMRIVPAGATREMLDKAPVGTGAFIFRSWDEKGITLEANKGYFRGRPLLDEVKFLFYPQGDRDLAFEHYLAGGLEGCPLTGTADVDELRASKHKVLIRPRLALLFYGINTRSAPLDDPKVRLAMALGHNQRQHVEETLGGNYIPAYQVVPRGMPGYTPDNALLRYEPERAAKLLAEAGYPGGEGLPEIEIASASSSDFARKELSLFAEDMAALGIRIKPVFVDGWDTFTKGLADGKYSIYRYAYFADMPDPDDFLAPLFEGQSNTNFSGWSNNEVDSRLGEAKNESDPVRRADLYRQAEKLILGQAPVIPVLFLTTQVTFQPYVKGIDLPATGTTNLPLHRVSLDR
jgi:peptide/nickel transport system substrate-binding protein/oligopeptide transport system substrate-binding protein